MDNFPNMMLDSLTLRTPPCYTLVHTAIDVLEFATIPSNASVILGAQIQQIHSQFHCSVQASRVTNFEWTFSSKSHPSSTQSTLHQISNELGSVDVKYSVVSTDYASTLTIEGVQFSDAGVYTCIASIGGTLEPIEASAHLIVEGKSHNYVTVL